MMLVDVRKILDEQEEAAAPRYGVGIRTGTPGGSDALAEVLAMTALEGGALWWTRGAWSMHDMLAAMLQACGPSDVTISSYAMNETAVRSMELARQTGLIKSLRCLVDSRVDVRSAGSFQLLQSIADLVCLAPCHAKVTLVQGTEQYSCLGSANYTENQRYEAGILSRMPADYNFHFQWINQAFRDGL